MTRHSNTTQLGFDALLAEAKTDNRDREFARETAHLPETFDEAVPFYQNLIAQNHAAMLAANETETRRLHREARNLAVKLNGGNPGILASDNAPGYVLARETAAESGTVPLWGQDGAFVVTVATMAVRIEMRSMFGIGAGWGFWPGFEVRAVDSGKPFLSGTGYRSFLGVQAEPEAGHTPDSFAAKVIASFVEHELSGKLVPIKKDYS